MPFETPDPILDFYTQRLDDMVFDVLPNHSPNTRYTLEIGAAGVTNAQSAVNDIVTDPFGPTTLLEYINNIRTASGLSTHPDLETAIQSQIGRAFYAEFLQSQGINPDPQALVDGNIATFGDWGVLANATGNGADEQFLIENFERVANEFIRTEFASGSATAPDQFTDFHNQWNIFLGTANFLNVNAFSDASLNDGQIGSFLANNITSYRDLYFTFVPDATQDAFEARLATFFQDSIDQNGYFLPGHFASDWFQAVQQERLEQFVGTLVDGTGSEQVRIIFEVFRLLVDMIGTLQRVAATQARRLTFYANMQRAFTTLISEIPDIGPDEVANLTNSFDSGGNVSRDRRNTILQSIQATNQAYTEQLRSFRSVWSDEARSHQTTVNESNETVNQQANLSTALLQQMSTILAAIFR